jgi:hypothetical protein
LLPRPQDRQRHFFFIEQRFGGERHAIRGFDMGLILTSENEVLGSQIEVRTSRRR